MKIQFNDTFRLSQPEDTCLWLVDIVGYSKIKNLVAQEELIKNMFNSVYGAVSEIAKIVKSDKTLAKELSSDDATVIWTGDGAIVATKTPFPIDTPLLLTSAFIESWKQEEWSHYNNSLSIFQIPKVHVAAHRGHCRWLQTPTLRSPLFEVSNCFGVDINVLARLATFSGEAGEFIVSEEYFQGLGCKGTKKKIKFSDSKNQIFQFTSQKSGAVTGKGTDVFKYREFKF